MMKSFFKKLAVVLAMAMVVSLAAPAATASAADAKEFTYKYQNGLGTAVKTINLAKTGDTVDLKFIGIPDYKNYELQWMSYGTGFELDIKTGVITATADEGEGVVWLSVGDDQTYVSDPIKVTIGQLKATIGTQDKSNKDLGSVTLKVGEKMDLAFYGITDWNLGKYGYKWVVADTSVLDVDQKTGEITALKAGETTVTFLAPNKFNQSNIVVTNALKVTVEPDAEPAIAGKQISEEFFYINFTDLTAANYDLDDIHMERVFPADRDTNGNGIIDARDDEGREEFFLKSATVNKDENRLEVTAYNDFVDGATYEIAIGDYKARFVASVGKVAYMELTATKAYLAAEGIAAIPAKLSVKLFDAKGIDVTNVEVNGIANWANVTYEISDYNKASIYNNEITFYSVGNITATAYFDYYNWDGRKEATCVVTAADYAQYDIEVVAWKVMDESDNWQKANKIDWNEVVKNNEPLWVACDDEHYHVVALLKDNRGNYFTTHEAGSTAYSEKQFEGKDVYLISYVDSVLGSNYVFTAKGDYLEFETLNPDNLLMKADGEVVTYKQTVSAIKLVRRNSFDTKVNDEIATVPLTVKAKRVKSILTINTTSTGVVTDTENDAYDTELVTTTVKATVFDQYYGWWRKNTDYDITLVTNDGYRAYTQAEIDNLNAYLATLGEGRRDAYNDNDVYYDFNGRLIRQCLEDYRNTNYSNRPCVTFMIKEKDTNRQVTVKVNLYVPVYSDNEVTGTIDIDESKIGMTITDNWTYDANKVSSSAWTNWDTVGWTAGSYRAANVNLYTMSKNYKVGFVDEQLPVWNGSYKLSDYATPLADGAQMLVVAQTSNNKAVTAAATAGAFDTAYRPSNAGRDAALGVKAVSHTDGKGNPYYTYEVVVASQNTDGSMAYMANGQYTVQVRTIKLNKNADGTLTGTFTFYNNNPYYENQYPATVQYFTVSNSNSKITLNGQVTRDLRESADTVAEVVAYAFNFNKDGEAWLNGGWNDAAKRAKLQALIAKVDAEVGDGYVYIKSVTFKVPVDPYADNVDNGAAYYFQKVNVGSSVRVSTDLFYFNN